MTQRQLWAALAVLVAVVVGVLVFAFDDASDDGQRDFGEDRSSSIVTTPNLGR
jgi:hypothetical protein